MRLSFVAEEVSIGSSILQEVKRNNSHHNSPEALSDGFKEMTKRSNLNLRTWALILNVLFWVCFWSYFALAAKVDDPKLCMDHCHPAYVYWGHGVGYNVNPFSLTFMRAMAYLQFPSFIVTKLAENVLTSEPLAGAFNRGIPNLSGGIVFLGVSFDGYQLLFTMLLSFVQWFLIATWLSRKFSGTSLHRNKGYMEIS